MEYQFTFLITYLESVCFVRYCSHFPLGNINHTDEDRNLNFGKYISATMNLTATQYLKTFLMRLVVILMNMIF